MIRASLVLALVALVGSAAADPAKATQLAEEANAAVVAGDFKLAAVKYTEAYREDRSRSDVFCNIGIMHFKLGEAPRAHLLLQLCIARSSLKLAFKDTAKAVVESIEQELRAGNHTPVTFKVVPDNAAVTVVEFGEESKFAGDRTVWLPFGAHQVTVQFEGYQPQTLTVDAADQNPKEVPIKLERIERKVEPPLPNLPEQPPSRPSKLPAIITSGVTVIGFGIAFFAAVRGFDAADAASAALDPLSLSDLEDEVTKWNRTFAIAASLTAVAAGVSGYLWYRALKTPPLLEVTPTAGGAAATFTRRF